MKYVLIIGAKSDIGKALAEQYARNKYSLYLAARESNLLEPFATNIAIRNQVRVKCVDLDVTNYGSHQEFYTSLEPKPIGVITVAGYLGDQIQAQNSFTESQKIIDTNYAGLVSILNIIANDFEKMKSGFIVGISSVAGDRGRKSNYLYGSAKAAYSTYLSGLRNRLFESNVHVMTVKPGFVFTKMTEELTLPRVVTAQPEEVSRDIYKAQQKGKSTLYTKWFWRWIMLVVKSIPEFKFKKMNL